MKKVCILYKEYNPTIDAIKFKLNSVQVNEYKFLPENEKFDLIVSLSGYENSHKEDILAVHHSLLPAFNSENPEKEAILAGVKVTGITFYYKNSGKIITQYPVFVRGNTHYEELKEELDYIEQSLYPIVIEKILNNNYFEIQDLVNKNCSGNCGGCSSCKQ